MPLTTVTITTKRVQEFIDITAQVRRAVKESGVQSGVCRVFVPHTTAAVTINENADPDVPTDMIAALDAILPKNFHYRHAEGNSPAHVKASLFGSSVTIFVEAGAPVLGTWQSPFFCEFDGPRSRTVFIRVSAC